MKNYNKTFVYNLSVDTVFIALLKVFILPCLNSEQDIAHIMSCITGDDYDTEEFAFIPVEYYLRLTETIIDPIQDNAIALGKLYDSLNGWIKTDSPLDIDLRKKSVQTDVETIQEIMNRTSEYELAKKDSHIPFPAEEEMIP